MKRVCVTGIAGFIGFHAALALKNRGDEVVGFDNFNTYYAKELKFERADKLRSCKIAVENGELTDPRFLKRYFETHQPTHLLHLAAQAGVRYSFENPAAFTETNLLGFCQLLEICRCRPEMPLVFASSSSVYGASEKTPFAEVDRTDKQISLYAATKKCNEVLAWTYHHLYGINATALRFFTVYGPWGRPDMAYWIFTRALLQKEPIQLNNHGQMQRDFTYIDDLVDGIVASLDKAAPFAIYNLGNRAPHTLLEFLQLLEKATGAQAIKRFCELPSGDVRATSADLTLSERDLDYFPKVSLETGLQRFVDWYRATKR